MTTTPAATPRIHDGIGEIVRVDTLHPHPDNAKKHDLDKIAESLATNGQYRPVVVNRGTLTGRPSEILAGHGTVRAAGHRLGWPDVAVSWVDVDDATGRRIVAVDNRSAELGGIDPDRLAALLEPLPDLVGTGYTAEDVAELYDDEAPLPVDLAGDVDDVPPPPADPITRLGDVWRLGPHRVLAGDCTNAALIAATFPEPSDLIATDPPYCSGGFQESGRRKGSVGTSAAHKMIANDTLSTRGYLALMRSMLDARPADFAYMFTDWRMWTALFDVAESKGYGVRSMIVWNKGTPGMGRGWRAQHELVMWTTKRTAPFDKHAAGVGNVITLPRQANDLHTTQKPVDLLVKLLELIEWADVVYDPFGGSGTTLIAAHHLGKRAQLVELDPAYVDTICRRWQHHTGELPVLESTGEPVDFVAPRPPAPEPEPPARKQRKPRRAAQADDAAPAGG